MRVLFVCTANKLRSPTAEDVFRDPPGIEVISAGTDAEAPSPLTKELVASADMIFGMETHHRERIRKKFKQRPPDNRLVTLQIPDEYERGDPELVRLLKDMIEPRKERHLAHQKGSLDKDRMRRRGEDEPSACCQPTTPRRLNPTRYTNRMVSGHSQPSMNR